MVSLQEEGSRQQQCAESIMALCLIMQIANISSTLGSIGDKEQYMENDDARRGNAFAVGGLAYKMSKAALNMRESVHLNRRIVCR